LEGGVRRIGQINENPFLGRRAVEDGSQQSNARLLRIERSKQKWEEKRGIKEGSKRGIIH